MKSIRSIYKVGNGPSSSHTVGPYNAAKTFRSRYPEADSIEVILYGSLAATGEGHGTGKAILTAIPHAKLSLDREKRDLLHPNTMHFAARKNEAVIGEATILSIGGGSIEIVGEESPENQRLYPLKTFLQIREYCEAHSLTLTEYIYQQEDAGIREFLRGIWHEMVDCVNRGLEADGYLPGGLHLKRKAKKLHTMRCHNESSDITFDRTLAAYAYAVCEENADEHIVVTAPTCGSCGIIPSVMYYMHFDKGFTEEEIIDGLAVAALIGNIIRTNASVSGAEAGCQAEIGSACSMAAAGLAAMYGLSIEEIESSAEIAMEHHLGLTCDPVMGLVQIPCIERNAVAAMRAVNAVNISRFLSDSHQISFDEVVATMYQTGLDMNEKYRETAHGGLAQIHAIYDEYGADSIDEFYNEREQ